MRNRSSVVRLRSWCAAGVLLLGAGLAGTAAPAAAADAAPQIPITEEVLSNGLRVLLIEAPKAPVVSVQVLPHLHPALHEPAQVPVQVFASRHEREQLPPEALQPVAAEAVAAAGSRPALPYSCHPSSTPGPTST